MKSTTRRQFGLTALVLASVGAVSIWFKKNDLLRWLVLKNENRDLQLTTSPSIDDDLCVLTSTQVEGPFFIAAPHRRDLREDRLGRQLNLELHLLSMPECAPIEGAIVEIWHCDAEGIYSGYPEEMAHDMWKSLMFAGIGGDQVEPVSEARFLRGAQISDRQGRVTFTTIFPGWYEPRTPHIHAKILVGDRHSLTTQFYFEPELCNKIYRRENPYTKFGECPFTPQNDVAIASFEMANGLLLQPVWSEDDSPLEASAKIGIEA